jgi:hypothetical protein
MAGLEMVVGGLFGSGCWWLVWNWLLMDCLEEIVGGLFWKWLLVAGLELVVGGLFGSGCWWLVL